MYSRSYPISEILQLSRLHVSNRIVQYNVMIMTLCAAAALSIVISVYMFSYYDSGWQLWPSIFNVQTQRMIWKIHLGHSKWSNFNLVPAFSDFTSSKPTTLTSSSLALFWPTNSSGCTSSLLSSISSCSRASFRSFELRDYVNDENDEHNSNINTEVHVG